MTTRRDALLALPLLYAASGASAQAPKAGPAKRMGHLRPESEPKTNWSEHPFYIALSKKGWTLGENLLREPAYADWKIERLAGLAEELVRKRVDVILCNGDLATLAAARATRTIPILFFNVSWPVEMGFIDTYGRPGRNVTGQTTATGSEVYTKRLQFLREIAPAAKRLSWLIPADLISLETVAGGRFELAALLEAAAKGLGFETRFHPFRTAHDIDAAFGEITAWRAQAVAAGAWPGSDMGQQRAAELALRHRLPSAFVYRWPVEVGGLLSYASSASESEIFGIRLIEYMDRILRGTPPADLPVEQPSRYELVINAKTAKAIGLTIPPALLARADEVIR
jgi:putative tryptophan/tyrosine transport system substrate-binding protein